MSGDWMSDPGLREWGQRVVKDLIPMVRQSACTVSIVPDAAGLADAKFAVELGVSIMLGKPIILVVIPGRQLPAKLVAVADEIVEVDEDPSDPGASQRLQAAISRVMDGLS